MTKPQTDIKKPRICFVAHMAFGALSGGSQGHIGGVERQTTLMARWFAARGYPVSMLTWDEGQPDEVSIDGVRVIKMCRADAGLRGLRFFHPRWTSLNRAMQKADADVYYHNCAEYATGQVALWCKQHARRFIFSSAHDAHCDRRLPMFRTRRDRFLYRYGLRHADLIIVQTRAQQGTLRDGFGINSQVLPMPCPGPSETEYAPLPTPRAGRRPIIWVGRICEQKRPDRLLDIAEQCPDLHFEMIGPVSDNEYAREVHERGQGIANVVMRGPIPRNRMVGYYRRSTCLCCTSDDEGFPNTFLEAWSYGLPVVSSFDPDRLIAEHGLGKVGNDVGGLSAGLRALLGSPEEWKQVSTRARQHYLTTYSVERAMGRFDKVFRSVLRM